MYESHAPSSVAGSLAAASTSTWFGRLRAGAWRRSRREAGGAITPWFLIRSSIASALVRLAPGFADHVARGRGVLDDRLQVLRQLVPGGLVDQQLRHRRRLVPAGRVVVLGRLVQAELAVLEGPDELGRVDDAALERGEDLAARQQLHVDAELRVDAAGQARDAHLQALEVGDRLDLLLEPAGHLHAGVAARHRHHAERRVDLVPQL